jgi:hypothetical protein
MRKPDAAFARGATTAPQTRERASRELVCLALMLALAALLGRIASMW